MDRGHEPCYADNGEVKSAEITETTNMNTLIIGDSVLRGMQQKVTNPEIKILYMPGASIKNLSGYLATQTSLPSTVVVHIGSNNAQTPNHVMRPLLLTIERESTKNFKNTYG